MWPGDALPQRGNTNWQVFYASNGWQTYMKPPGASMIYFLILAAGGGGNRPPDGGTTGGGGGGSGGMSRILIPAAFIPDIIYVRPGVGGLGATTANTVGAGGGNSLIGIAPVTTATNLIYQQGGATPAVSPQAVGSGGPIGNFQINSFASLAIWMSVGGQNGTAGSASANANVTDITPGASGIITTGGGGGSNGTGSPGDIVANGLFPALTTDTSVSTGARDGLQRGAIIEPGLKSFPLIFSGGTGGFGRNAGNSWNGANASYGGGGGGGGANNNVTTSGNGGNGGDGLIIIGTL